MKITIILTILISFIIGFVSTFAQASPISSNKEVKKLEESMKQEIAKASTDQLLAPHNRRTIKIQYGLGIGDVAEGEVLNGSEKNVNIGCYSKLNKVLGWGTHVGLISAEGISAGYAFVQFGSVLHPFDWMYVDHYFGPGYVMEGNSKIAEGINFSMHMGIGWRDPIKGTTIGMNWKHISNAGIRKPNKGMDFVLIQVGIPI